jgi:hypothetical protein
MYSMRSNQKIYKVTLVHNSIDKKLQSFRIVVVIGLGEARKIIQGHKFMGSVINAIG